MSRRGLIAVAAVALSAVAAPATAQATFTPTLGASATSTQAGAATDFTTTVNIPASDEDVRDLTFHLPPGLIGNPQATPLCPQATFNSGTCPTNTQVGTTVVSASISAVPVPDSNGQVFNLEPSAGEPARLGVVIQVDPLGVNTPIKIPVVASLRPNDGGLDATATNIPNTITALNLPLHVTKQILTLQGHPAGATIPFITNPTGCPSPADNVTIDATSYSNTNASASAAYPVTGCASLPFNPNITAASDVSGGSAVGSHVSLSTVITQGSGETNPKKLVVALPPAFTADTAAIGRSCGGTALANDMCPANTKVGTATAQTPVLSQPLSGNIYSAANGLGLAGFTIFLHGQVALRLDGSVNPNNNTVTSTFDNIPDVPISRFQVNFAAGPDGALLAAQDLCQIGPQKLNTQFFARSGATKALTPDLTVTGCPAVPKGNGKPHAKITARKLGGAKPKLSLSLTAGDSALAGATLKLPKLLVGHPGKGKVKVSSDKGSAKGKARRHTLVVPKLPDATSKLNLTASGGAITASAALKRKLAAKPKASLGFRLKVRQQGAGTVTLRVSAKGTR